eukprot:114671-Alexandrium_andersonii.AAC.1
MAQALVRGSSWPGSTCTISGPGKCPRAYSTLKAVKHADAADARIRMRAVGRMGPGMAACTCECR